MFFQHITDYLDAITAIIKHQQRELATKLGLQPIHMQIIQYLGRCNKYSDSHQSLCDFLGQTKGSLSTSVALLETKNLVLKQADAKDKRKSHMRLTSQGTEVFDQLQQAWSQSLDALVPKQQQTLLHSLNDLLLGMQKANNNKIFGVCQSCKHLLKNGKEYRCGLTGQELVKDELELICTFHELD